VPLTEGDLNLGDNRILFSWGDLIICTCDLGDFLRFSVGGFSAFLPTYQQELLDKRVVLDIVLDRRVVLDRTVVMTGIKYARRRPTSG
jgi:hypothetical protein